MGRCAYCDSITNKITNEHVVSKAFLDKFYQSTIGYARVYDKYTENYLTIHDVCQVCNNEVLSVLDSYFLNFYETNIPAELIGKDTTISISYDFDKLSKWLLKTVYNSERKNTYQGVPKKLQRFKNYILGKDSRTKLFRIYLELLQDVSPEEIKTYVQPEVVERLPSKLAFLRMGTIVRSDQLRTGVTDLIKHFTSSNFLFHIFILDPGQHTTLIFKNKLQRYRKVSNVKNLTYLDPDSKSIDVRASNRTIIDILERTVEGDAPVFSKIGTRMKKFNDSLRK